MGTLAAIELANKVNTGTMSLSDAVGQHLSTGFVRSVRAEWAPVCIDIIERYKNGDEDITYKIHAPGKPADVFLTAESIIEDLHLDAFIGECE